MYRPSRFAIPFLVVLAASAAALVGCARKDDAKPVDVKVPTAPGRTAGKVPPPSVRFTDVTEKAGIRFIHTNGASGKKLMPETLGGGCAFLDFDNDGHHDLLLVNSCHWPGHEWKGPPPTMALYRNKGNGTFDDVTKDAGLDVTFYGMGPAVGDFDNDGLVDVFLSGVGGSHLFRNTKDNGGKHRFVDVTKDAGDLVKSWNWPKETNDFLAWDQPLSFPSSAAFLDYDKDGKLDLFVCSYVQWSPRYDLAQGFTLRGVGRAYGPPTTFEGTHSRLYRNKGDGTFEDVSRRSGVEVLSNLARPAGKALAVVVFDPDDDGWPDLAVANDTVRNLFFHNQGDGTFKERGEEVGIAYAEGTARGAMGIDWGQYRAPQVVDGKRRVWRALLIGNFANEPDTLFCQDPSGRLLFADVASSEGVAGDSRLPLVFGLFFFDYDLDGRLDFLTNNGHLEPDIHTVQPNQSYKQAPQLFWNTGAGPSFELVRETAAGTDLFKPLVGRGCAYADIDGNGTPDVVLCENGGPARLLKNEGGLKHRWVRLVLEGDGKTCNKSAVGARVTLRAGDVEQTREVGSSRGYLSCSELPLTFGLGSAEKVERVEVRWPGRDVPVQVLTDLEVNKVHRVRQLVVAGAPN